ncbi:hypothetical protein QQF64_024006 [Cirrhinus molitorella]|uniref:Uncharacterized protein n=1 Tax=Cirrhinus molitorella TaxID=172907 RepID=A0ABR3NK03_9TELE
MHDGSQGAPKELLEKIEETVAQNNSCHFEIDRRILQEIDGVRKAEERIDKWSEDIRSWTMSGDDGSDSLSLGSSAYGSFSSRSGADSNVGSSRSRVPPPSKGWPKARLSSKTVGVVSCAHFRTSPSGSVMPFWGKLGTFGAGYCPSPRASPPAKAGFCSTPPRANWTWRVLLPYGRFFGLSFLVMFIIPYLSPKDWGPPEQLSLRDFFEIEFFAPLSHRVGLQST